MSPAPRAVTPDLHYQALEPYHNPGRDVEVVSEGDEIVELAATLVPTTASAEDLDAITSHLEKHPEIEDATWTVSTTS